MRRLKKSGIKLLQWGRVPRSVKRRGSCGSTIGNLRLFHLSSIQWPLPGSCHATLLLQLDFIEVRALRPGYPWIERAHSGRAGCPKRCCQVVLTFSIIRSAIDTSIKLVGLVSCNRDLALGRRYITFPPTTDSKTRSRRANKSKCRQVRLATSRKKVSIQQTEGVQYHRIQRQQRSTLADITRFIASLAIVDCLYVIFSYYFFINHFL